MNQQTTPPQFKDIVRIFSFFKEYVNATDFTIEEIQFALETQNTHLLEYLMTQLFEDIYQSFKEKGNTIQIFKLLVDNKSLRQCQLWDGWLTVYQELAFYFDKINKRKSNQEVLNLLYDDFNTLKFEQKIKIILHFINSYSLQLDHIKEQIHYNQDLLKELPVKPKTFQKSREQWQIKLDQLQEQIQPLPYEKRISYSQKQKYQQSKKKNEEIMIQQRNLETLLGLNYDICLLFKFNQLAVLHRGKEMDLLIFRHLPNRLIVNTTQGYQEYYGDDAFAFVKKQGLNIDMSYFCRTLRKLPNPTTRTDFLVLDPESKKEYMGETKFLVYGKCSTLELIVEILLSIEERVSRCFLEQYDMVWGSKFQREQWMDKVKQMKEEEQVTYAVNSLIPTLRQMHFVEGGENSDGSQQSKRFFGQFKKYSFDMNYSNYLQIMCIYWIVITQLKSKRQQNIIDSDDDY